MLGKLGSSSSTTSRRPFLVLAFVTLTNDIRDKTMPGKRRAFEISYGGLQARKGLLGTFAMRSLRWWVIKCMPLAIR